VDQQVAQLYRRHRPAAAPDRVHRHARPRRGFDGGKPDVDSVDGTASFAADGSSGVLFLFNPGPRPTQAYLMLDESLGISNASSTGTWLANELYPREENAGSMAQTPIGLWNHGDAASFYVPATSAMVIRLRRQAPTDTATSATPTTTTTPAYLRYPLVLNLTHTSAASTVVPTGNTGQFYVKVNVTGATGLEGATAKFEVMVAVADPKLYRLQSVYVNGILAYKSSQDQCTTAMPTGTPVSCGVFSVTFGGSALLRNNQEATLTSPDPNATFAAPSWFNSTLNLDAALLAQLNASQKRYPVPWVKGDMTATWLGNRLLLYIYVTQPGVNTTRPRLFLGGEEQQLTEAYNSRGNKDNRCFLGFYFDATPLAAGQHPLALWLPKMNGTSQLRGVFWSGIRDSSTSEVVGPQPAGNLRTCAAAAAAGEAPAPAKKGLKNVLYLVVDDLRPQLGAYGQKQTLTPNLDAFAQTATVFDNAYCNIAVCSPSRNSFLSGMWPRSSHIYNFVNHVRQATCPDVVGATAWVGGALRNVSIAKTEGAAGECCSECTADPACHAWTYTGA